MAAYIIAAVKNAAGTPVVPTVDGSGNLNVNIAAGAAAGGTSQTDKAAFTSGTTPGTPAQGVYEASPTTLSDGQIGMVGLTNDRKLKVSGSFSSSPITASTSVVSNVTASAVSATALAANASRLGGGMVNDADVACYLKAGTTASVTSYTRKLFPGEGKSFEELFGVNYTGRIDVIWDAAPTGALRVTEMTA